MKAVSFALPVLFLSTGMALANLKAQVLPPWNGKTVPAGQQCTLNGGNREMPPLQATGIPAGTVMLVVEYDDKSYSKLSNKGGHGTIGYTVNGTSGKSPAAPGMTTRLTSGIVVVKKARSTGDYASAGYLPPGSGGRGHTYQADVRAIDAKGKALAKTKMNLGRY